MSSFGFDPNDIPDGVMPDDMRQHLIRQAEMQKMNAQANYHEMNGFLDSQTEENLGTLQKLIYFIMSHPVGGGAYYNGRIDALLQSKFKVCACGEKHDESIDAMLRHVDSGNVHVGPGDPEEDVEDTLILKRDFDPEPFDHPRMGAPFRLLGDVEQKALMDEWNLDIDSNAHVRCIKCGIRYVSVEDRLLRPKDGCQGCHKMSSMGAPQGPRPGDREW